MTPERKTLSIKYELFAILEKMKREEGVSYSTLISKILRERKEHKQELERLERKVNSLNEYIRNVLEKMASSTSQHTIIQSGGSHRGVGDNYGQLHAPPSPPIPINTSDIPDIVDIETDAEVKQAFEREKKAVFNGTMRKPSEIIAITNPKHREAEIKVFNGKRPSLVKTSFALKHAKRFKEEKQKEL